MSPPSSRAKPFFLVLSVGRCKFRLSPSLVEHILQAVIGGFPRAFDVVQLSDRVFRFSVASQLVGFHIYNLRSFECVDYKVFFHLWHNGGPNYVVEYRNWSLEEAAEWKEAAKRKTVRLTGANAVPVFDRCLPPPTSNSMAFSNFRRQFNVGRNSVFKSINSGNNSVNHKIVSYMEAGVLGVVPNPKRIKTGHGLYCICVPIAYLWPILGPPAATVFVVGDVFGLDTFLISAMSCLDPRAFPLHRMTHRILGFIMLPGR